MNIKRYSNAAEFLKHTGKYLSRDEARYGLILGLARVVERNMHRYGPDNPWFCSIGIGGDINAVAMRTPPYMVLMSHFSGNPKTIANKLITAVSKQYSVIPGVVGDKELADVFSKCWCDKFGARIQHTMAQCIYRLDKVNEVPLAPGRFRIATIADKDLVIKWTRAFAIEAGSGARNTPEKDITPVLEHGWVFFWEDGKPVSMAFKVRPTDKGMTITEVYTPPEFRRKGYATSCVAELSRNILQSGKEFCMLYTDLSNPTSNSIYKKIGYKEVGDSVQHTFVTPEA